MRSRAPACPTPSQPLPTPGRAREIRSQDHDSGDLVDVGFSLLSAQAPLGEEVGRLACREAFVPGRHVDVGSRRRSSSHNAKTRRERSLAWPAMWSGRPTMTVVALRSSTASTIRSRRTSRSLVSTTPIGTAAIRNASQAASPERFSPKSTATTAPRGARGERRGPRTPRRPEGRCRPGWRFRQRRSSRFSRDSWSTSCFTFSACPRLQMSVASGVWTTIKSSTPTSAIAWGPKLWTRQWELASEVTVEPSGATIRWPLSLGFRRSSSASHEPTSLQR